MRVLRIALICLLMLALPAQSMAAISMQLCAVTQQCGASAQVDSQMAAHHPAASAKASAHGVHHASDISNTSYLLPIAVCAASALFVSARWP